MMTASNSATVAPGPAIAPVTLLARVLSVLGASHPAAPSGPLSALGVLAWGMFRDLETGMLGGVRGGRVGAGAPVAAAPQVPGAAAPTPAEEKAKKEAEQKLAARKKTL